MTALPANAPIGVVGAGTMGAGIAQVAASAGHPVVLFDARAKAVAEGMERIRWGLEQQVARGRLEQGGTEAILKRMQPAGRLQELAPAALVIEAIAEDLPAKRGLFQQLEVICDEDTILASNTSSLSITALAAGLRHPGRLIGMHFFNPAPVLKLVEVVSGLATAPAIAQTVHETVLCWGKQPVDARSSPGFIVNRVARPFYAEALRVLEEGSADIATIDAVFRECGGFRMGPFELMDLIGLDINFAVSRSLHAAFFQDPRYRPSLLQQEMVEAGRLGRKSGCGFYDYRQEAIRPAPHEVNPGPRPDRAMVRGELGPAEALVESLQGAGIAVQRSTGPGVLVTAGVTLALSDGRSATQRAATEAMEDLVVFDLALDFARSRRILLAPADQAPAEALAAAAGLFQAIGKTVSVIDDSPGLLILRTVCMLANAAADAVHQGVCTATACDAAMCAGVNYPRGPLAWADAIGVSRVVAVLDHLHTGYGEDRYRVSPLLRRKHYGGRRYHE